MAIGKTESTSVRLLISDSISSFLFVCNSIINVCCECAIFVSERAAINNKIAFKGFMFLIFCKNTNNSSFGKKNVNLRTIRGDILLYHWHQSTSSVSVERYSKGGVVGSGIKALNSQILSKSSIKLFENNSVRGTNRDAIHWMASLFISGLVVGASCNCCFCALKNGLFQRGGEAVPAFRQYTMSKKNYRENMKNTVSDDCAAPGNIDSSASSCAAAAEGLVVDVAMADCGTPLATT